MARVPIRGKLVDGGGDVLDPTLQPRLWGVPERAVLSEGEAITDDEVLADLTLTGSNAGDFTIMLDNAIGLRWRLWVDRLVPGQETEPTERRSRQWVQWTDWFYPGAGGDIGQTAPVDNASVMWVGPTPPPTNDDGTWDPGLRWLNNNPSSSEYGWISRWEA